MLVTKILLIKHYPLSPLLERACFYFKCTHGFFGVFFNMGEGGALIRASAGISSNTVCL